MTPYVSIDIETTGLNPDTCQVLEIGAVVDRGIGEVEDLPKFRAVLKHDQVKGEPYAFSMHGTLLREMALLKIPDNYCSENDLSTAACIMRPNQVVQRFLDFLALAGIPLNKGFTPAGKNFAGFDKGFLEQCVPSWKSDVKIKHRTIDPGNLFWREDDEFLPDTKTCYERAGLPPDVAHTAVEDALGVVRLVRAYWAEQKRLSRQRETGACFTEAFGMVQVAIHPTLRVNVDDPYEMAREIIRYNDAPPIGGSM